MIFVHMQKTGTTVSSITRYISRGTFGDMIFGNDYGFLNLFTKKKDYSHDIR